jgi:uncharacterized protein
MGTDRCASCGPSPSGRRAHLEEVAEVARLPESTIVRVHRRSFPSALEEVTETALNVLSLPPHVDFERLRRSRDLSAAPPCVRLEPMDDLIAARHPADATHPVERPVMLQRWADVTYLHWPLPALDVARVLPPGLEVDTHDGLAWVGLVPFIMRELRLPGVPALPWLSTFPEVNVRTYVVGPRGPGVWFCSLDAARLGGVLVALTGYGLQYRWARMRAARRGDELRFWSARRWPGPPGARAHVGVRLGAAVESPDALDQFHTNRWGLYTRMRGGGLAFAPVEHGPWRLRRADLTVLTEDVVAAAGLTRPATPPRIRYSPGVEVRIGLPRRL